MLDEIIIYKKWGGAAVPKCTLGTPFGAHGSSGKKHLIRITLTLTLTLTPSHPPRGEKKNLVLVSSGRQLLLTATTLLLLLDCGRHFESTAKYMRLAESTSMPRLIMLHEIALIIGICRGYDLSTSTFIL
jgi:hypothetical protein